QLHWLVFYLACLTSFGMIVLLVSTLQRAVCIVDGRVLVTADCGAAIIIQIIIMIVSISISYAMRAKTVPVKPQESTIPDVEDGTAIPRIYGEVWSDDSFILGWKNLGTEAIKSKGGKKWKPGLLPGTTNPIESWMEDEW